SFLGVGGGRSDRRLLRSRTLLWPTRGQSWRSNGRIRRLDLGPEHDRNPGLLLGFHHPYGAGHDYFRVPVNGRCEVTLDQQGIVVIPSAAKRTRRTVNVDAHQATAASILSDPRNHDEIAPWNPRPRS